MGRRHGADRDRKRKKLSPSAAPPREVPVPVPTVLPQGALPPENSPEMREHLHHCMQSAWGRMRHLYALHSAQPSGNRTEVRRSAASLGLHPTAQRIIRQLWQHDAQPVEDWSSSTGVIYAIWFNLPGHNRIYVGKTIKTMAQRLHGHLTSAYNMAAQAGVRKGEAYWLYTDMVQYGIKNLMMVPLVKLRSAANPVLPNSPPADWKHESVRAERWWIERLKCLGKAGYNSMCPGGRNKPLWRVLAQEQQLWDPFRALHFQPGPDSDLSTLPYSYRDYDRRLSSLHDSLVQHGPQHVADALQAGYKLRNLSRMLIVGRCHRVPYFHHVPERARGASLHLSRQTELLSLIEAEIARRQATWQPPKRAVRKLFSPLWCSPLMDKLPLARLLSDPVLLRLLPSTLSHVGFLLAPKYSTPIGRMVINHWATFDGREYTFEQLQELAQQPCICHTLPANFCVPGSDGHVVTADPEVFSHLCPQSPHLPAVLALGSKFRPHTHTVASEAVLQDVRSHLFQAVNALVQRMSRDFRVSEDALRPWAGELKSRMQDALNQIPAGSSVADADAPVLSKDDRDALKSVQKHFLCCNVDKAATTLAIVCKHHAVHLVLRDLHPADGSTGPFTAMTASPEQILAEAAEHLPTLHEAAGKAKVAVYSGIPKFHKLDAGSIKWRFLSYSADVCSTPLARHLTWLFKAIQQDVQKLWESLPFPPGLKELHKTFWILTNSAGFIPVVHSWNSRQTLFQHQAPARLHSYDFARLYTNLDHTDLKRRLESLLRDVWGLHGGDAKHVKVSASGRARWAAGAVPAPRLRSWDGERSFTFTLASAVQCLEYLIDHAFIRVGDRIYRQTVGIPMGSNPCVYLANFYLFVYEYEFMQDLLRIHCSVPMRVHARRVLDAFSHTRRYIDDLAQITHESADFVAQFFYTSQLTQHGIHGIYPDSLQLEPTFTEPAASMDFMDLTIAPAEMPDGSFGPLVSTHFDKRRGAAFRRVHVRRFPHIQSMISSKCKYGVLGSRFVHLARTVTEVRCLIREVGGLVVDMARERYDVQRLLREVKRFAMRLAVNFGLPFASRSGRRLRSARLLNFSLYKAIRKSVLRSLYSSHA